MRLNCDLGEGCGIWRLGQDREIMPHIDEANIACGFHAGDPDVMVETLLAAKQHGVEIGAHPGYPDLVGFGRRSMRIAKGSLINLLHYQIAALDGVAASHGLTLGYVKPHGALYNDMMRDESLLEMIIEALDLFYKPLDLVVMATARRQNHIAMGEKRGVKLRFEAFADRRYQSSAGDLVARDEDGAVLKQDEILQQVETLMKHRLVETASGERLTIEADTLCVHSDNSEAVAIVAEIRKFLLST